MSIGLSARFRPILNFPIFRENWTSMELLNTVFENSLQKGFVGEIRKSNFLTSVGFSIVILTTALKISDLLLNNPSSAPTVAAVSRSIYIVNYVDVVLL